jgi:hypothetical protein
MLNGLNQLPVCEMSSRSYETIEMLNRGRMPLPQGIHSLACDRTNAAS